MAERILLRLVRPGIGQDNVANRIRRVSLYTIGPRENVDRVLNTLVAQHFVRLTAGDTEEDTEVEIAHEALIRNWQHLVSLLETERQHMTTLRRLEIKAAEWVRLGRGTSVVLRDATLAEAEQWLANPDFAALGASNDLRQLVKLSRDEANSARRRSSIIRVALVILTIVSAVSAGVAIMYAIEARKETDRAENKRKDSDYNWNEALKQKNEVDEQKQKVVDLNGKLQEANSDLKRALNAAKTAEARSADEAQLFEADQLATQAQDTVTKDPEQASLLALQAEAMTLRVKLSRDESHQAFTREIRDTLAHTSQANRVRVVLPLLSEANSLAFSPDGLRLATATKNEPVQIWDAVTGRQLVEFAGTKSAAAVAFSYSGRQIAVALDNRIQILDALSGKSTAQPHTTNGAVRRLAFSPNDNYVAAITSAGTVELWSLVSQFASTLSQAGTTMTAFAFNPTGAVIVTGSDDGLVRTWETVSGGLMQTVAKFEQHEDGTPPAPITDLALSPDGLILEISRSNGQRQQLSFTEGEPKVAHQKESSSRISFANDRSLLALEANGGNLFRASLGLPVPVNVSPDVVAFGLDGNRFAAVAHGTTVKIWDVGYIPAVNSNKQPDKNMPDVIGQAIASLTDVPGSSDDCKNKICTELRASVPDIAEGNRLAMLGEINRALAKFASAATRTPWLRGDSNVEDWARKEVRFIQDKTASDFSSQKQKGESAQAQFMLRAGSNQALVPQTAPLSPQTQPPCSNRAA